MQERINATDHQFADVVVQFDNQYPGVGIGLEPCNEVPSLHFVDAVYGDAPTQTEIGRLFIKRLAELGINETSLDFKTSDAEAEWFNKVGRVILDSVTGSQPNNGLWTLWTWLDRGSVNRMIRVLRKARDIAFGRDE